MQTTDARGDPERLYGEKTLGTAELEIVPLRHFREQYRAKFGPFGTLYRNGTVRLSGTLVKSPCADKWFLDVNGLGRVVLRRTTRSFLGITIVPAHESRTPLTGGI